MFPARGRQPSNEATISDNNLRSTAAGGPAISAVPFREISDGRALALLGERERERLANIASLVRFRRGTTIYREGDPADSIYNIVKGVVKTFQTAADGTRRILAFLFADDLLGLTEEGVYVNQAEAVTEVTAYWLPLNALEDLVRNDPALDYPLLLKLSHELREAQRHGLLLARHDALGRVAMFIGMLERLRQARGSGDTEIFLPMSRSDIADYAGLSLAAISRTFRALVSRNIIRFSDRRHLQIVDRGRFEDLVSQSSRDRDEGR